PGPAWPAPPAGPPPAPSAPPRGAGCRAPPPPRRPSPTRRTRARPPAPPRTRRTTRRVRPAGSHTRPARSPGRPDRHRPACLRSRPPPRPASTRSPAASERLREGDPVVERVDLAGDLLAPLVPLAQHRHHVGRPGTPGRLHDRRLPARDFHHFRGGRAGQRPGPHAHAHAGEHLRPDRRRILRARV